MANEIPTGHRPEHRGINETPPEAVEPISDETVVEEHLYIEDIPPVEQSRTQWRDFLDLADQLSPDPLAELLLPELARSLGQLESALQQEAEIRHLEISHQWLHYQIITACVEAGLLAKAMEKLRDAIMFTHGLKDDRWEDLFLDLKDKLYGMIDEISPADLE